MIKNNTVSIDVSKNISDNKSAMQAILIKSIDIVYYDFETGDKQKYLIAYLDDIINKEILGRDVIGVLTDKAKSKKIIHEKMSIKYLKSTIHFTNIYESKDINEIVDKFLSGDVIIFIEGLDTALCLPSQSWQQRGIIEPEAEIITKGPREGFVETLKTNRSMIRRKIQNTTLVFEALELGTETNTAINIVYIDNIVDKDILNELKRRLGEIDIDSILDTGYIDELIKDKQYSPFNTTGYTERPDVVAAKLLEGRIAVLCDGSPIALTVPFLFIENLQSNEDYYTNFFAASINRILRFVSFFLTIFLPGIFVAILTNHHEILPSKLLFSFISSRSGVPFPTIIEMLLMILVFELLRESGLRLPKGLGQTVSIVGALVLGQAAVDAKFISAGVVIIIAITAITSFIFYQMNGAIIISRIFITILGAIFGLYGVTLGLIFIFIHMYSIHSFGVPYMSYIGSTKGQDIKDSIIRAPWWYMYLRPKIIAKRNLVRKGQAKDK